MSTDLTDAMRELNRTLQGTQAGEEAQSGQRALGGETIIIFLGLYLLLCAFFILLNSISTIEEDKSKEVLDSVNNAFKMVGFPATMSEYFTSDIGSYAEASASLVKIGNLVKTAIELAKVKEVKPGQIMKIEVPPDSLFVPGEARFVGAADDLLDSIGLILSRPPPDLRFDVEVVVGSNWILPEDLDKGETLEIARAGAFARELRARGTPEDTTVAGIEYGDPEKIEIFFYVRAADKPRLDFGELAR